ncbi:MAG: TonB-dependent receptor [Bacteroidetes bacterium]|nr:TonB-dependent receptor [Bacteroidota bacterium]
MKRIATVAFCILPLLLISQTLHAQRSTGGVKGIVSDSLTGERLTLVNVYLPSEGMGAATDANGFYFIGNIPAGTHTVRATLIGYGTVIREITITGGKIVTMNFELTPSIVEMEMVETTAERRIRYDTEISTQPISAAEISVVPKAVEADLFRTIAVLPGVVATSDVSSQFYVRGGGGDQNLIILDGMTIYNPFHALGIFSIFDADAVKEAEILKGGFPAQWGNRLSSVINIRTREGNKKRFSGKLNMSQVAGKALLEGPTPWEGSWMLSVRKSFFDEVLQKFVRQETPFDFYDVIGRMNVATGDAGRLSVHTLFSGDVIQPGSEFDPEYRWNNAAYGMSWFQVLENKYLIETTFSFSNFLGELRPRANTQITPRLSEVNDVYFNGSVTYFRDNGDQYGAGFMFRLPEYHYRFVNSANYERDEVKKNSETGIWFKYKLKQFRPFSLELGIRSDIFSVLSPNSSDAFEPRLGFAWDISPALAFKASYGRVHQRVITITNEDDVVSLFETWIPVPEDEPSQQADHYIVGFDGDIPLVPGLNFNVQGYYKDLKNLVDYNRDKVDAADPDFVRATGRSYGMEFFLEERHPRYYGMVSYTLSYTERQLEDFTYNPRYDRRHNLNIIAGWKPGDGWDVNVRWEYGSGLPFSQIIGFYDRLLFTGLFDGNGYIDETGQPYTMLGPKNSGRLPAYHRLDVSASKAFQFEFIRLVLEASVLNVYDRSNMFYYDRTSGERIDMLPILPTVNLRIEF